MLVSASAAASGFCPRAVSVCTIADGERPISSSRSIASRNFRRSPSRKLSVFFVETFCEPEGAWISADAVTGGKAAATTRAAAAVTIRLLHCPYCFFINGQLIRDPEEMFLAASGVIRASVPSSPSAQRSMPSERTPASFAGFKLQRTMTFFPTISSGE